MTMLRAISAISMLSLAVILCNAQTPQATQSATATEKSISEGKLAQLKAHAEKMHEQDRGRVYSDIARELAEIANQQFIDGHPEQAQASIKEGLSYAEKAKASAQQHGKKIKDTEINLREYARRLDEIRRSVAADEQPPIKQAVARVDQLRKELLDQMFRRN
jgi:hypothetical protein